MPAARKITRRPGIVFVLVALFTLSLSLRVGQAAVQDGSDGAEEAAPETEMATDAPIQCTEPALASLLDDLIVREASARETETTLAAREAKLAGAEERLAAGLEQMRQAQAKLDATLAALTEAQESDITALVATYEAMKPDQAIPLFAAMNPDFAAEFLRRMKPNFAAPILAGLEPRQAYALSVILAGRSAAKINEASGAAEAGTPMEQN